MKRSNKKKIQLITISLLFALIAQTLGAQEFADIFRLFLSTFIERHEQLEYITMPDVEIHTVPNTEGDALYILSFKTEEDSQIFLNAISHSLSEKGFKSGCFTAI